MKAQLLRFSEAIRRASSASGTLRLRGGGTKDFYGQDLAGELLETRDFAGIVAYEPSELVITARCGTALAELERTLQERSQFLPFEPPFGPAGATLGGVIAAGLSGPRRAAVGAVRDFVLGARVMDGQGNALAFGGQVMKNVAGYDVSRLLAGSLGTLGLILEVSLKILPRPVEERTLRLDLPEDRAIEMMNQWATRPLPVSATAWRGGHLGVRLSGAAAALRAAEARIGGEPVDADEADRFWSGMRDQTDPFFASELPIWRFSVPSTRPVLGLPGDQLIEWSGALRWCATGADARTVRELAGRLGGHATLYRNGDKAVGVFSPLAAGLDRVHRELKRALDPQGVFNRGRMYPGW